MSIDHITTAIETITHSNSVETYQTAFKVLFKLLDNMLSNRLDTKFRKINKSNKVIESKLLSCKGMLSLLSTLGYEEVDYATLEYAGQDFEPAGYAREALGSILGVDNLELAMQADGQASHHDLHDRGSGSLTDGSSNSSPHKHKKSKHSKEIDIFSDEQYDGQSKWGWYEGFGRYQFRNGVVYEGEFHKGEFHGNGTLIYPNGGKFKARWERGRMIDGEYEYYDGLMYNSENWDYCQSHDRRFYTEIKEGLRPAGATLIVNDPAGPPRIPSGTYDAGVGQGYYDPRRDQFFTYDGEEIPAPEDMSTEWILDKCRYQPADIEDLTDDETVIP
jgi:hypothetical protein